LNLVVIRYTTCCLCITQRMIKRQNERGTINRTTLDRLLFHHPVRTIILLRLPYLASGIINYTLSSTPTLSVRHQLIGNAIGLLCGALLFSCLGDQVRSLLSILFDGSADVGSIVVFVVITLFVVISIVGLLVLGKKTALQQAAQADIASPLDMDLMGGRQEVSTEDTV